jgi:hypothetical protein
MDTTKLHEYAWNWFEYHARQRLTEFRFFLIFFGALALGFRTGLEDGNLIVAKAICVFGAFISFAFLMLECRNEHLVNVGRDALMYLEQSTEFSKDQPKLQLLNVDQHCHCWLQSHGFWFKAIYIVCMVLFIIGAFDPGIVLTST